MRFFLPLFALCFFALPALAQQRTAAPSEVFEVVEQMPEIDGGIEALLAQLHYPEDAKRSGVEGRVLVRFVVDKQGRTSDYEVLRSADERLEEAALAAVQATRFLPGRQRGEAVSVRMVLPIMFELADRSAADE